MQLNNPIFINQTDADIRYVNTTGDSINGLLSVTGLTVSGLGNSFILKSPNNYDSVVFESAAQGGAGILRTNYLNTIGLYSFGDNNLSLIYGGGGARSVIFNGFNGSVSANRALLDSNGNFGIASGISSVPARFYVSGNSIINGTLSLSGNQLVDYVPQFINENTNFIISGNDNGRVILANSASQITATIVSGNVTGFNTTIIQIGAGQIFVTGSGINASIPILSYNNQYKTAGAGATVSVLHTGNNRYIMYGNTSL